MLLTDRSSICAWWPSCDLLEDAREVEHVGETDARRNSLELIVCVGQEILGNRDADARDIASDAQPDLGAKEMGKVTRRNVSDLREACDCQALVKAGADPVECLTRRSAEPGPCTARIDDTGNDDGADLVHQNAKIDR